MRLTAILFSACLLLCITSAAYAAEQATEATAQAVSQEAVIDLQALADDIAMIPGVQITDARSGFQCPILLCGSSRDCPETCNSCIDYICR